MCGIVGYIGQKQPEKVLVERLKQLEYRGYDSAGIAIKNGEEIAVFKAKGEIRNLEKVIREIKGASIGIGHTRWATHGKPNEINAHPLLSFDSGWAVVHNGIIENYKELKTLLEEKGLKFCSETDTETVAQLLEYNYDGDGLSALKKTCDALHGSYALAVLSKAGNGIYFAKNKSPLYIAEKDGEIMLASDIMCFYGFSQNYYVLEDGEYGYAHNGKIVFLGKLGEVEKKPVESDYKDYTTHSDYKHFMLKEIYETKQAIKNIIEFYSESENYKALNRIDLNKIERIKLVGCGTAYHAGLMGAIMLEDKLQIECSAYVASEFRYQNPPLEKTLVILISQSGETADTLAAQELAQEKNAQTLALVNVEYSTLAKKADMFIPIKAGVEIAVASTKAYSAQITVLYILADFLAAKKYGEEFSLNDIKCLYENIDVSNVNNLKLLADIFQYNDKLFMIGRGADYCTALEASLKIKETSYINSDTYYAGELKHGFLALIDEKTYVIVFATEKKVLSKTLCNAEEARARGAKLILFTCFDLDEKSADNFYYIIKVKNIENMLQSVLNILPWQIIAYYTSINKGINPDKPRNLAKSVTVE